MCTMNRTREEREVSHNHYSETTQEQLTSIMNSQEPISTTTCMKLETEAKKKPVQVSLKPIDADDLKSIKKDDPFLYYSIPEVRKAAMVGRHIGVSELGGILDTMNDKGQSESVVKRQTRISFECPLDVCLMDELGLSDDEFEDSDGEEFLEFILAQLNG
mmetsp:Transcript_34134/g.71859  ORF Transcript_34134/g.71859 Transcript_34134/m.71859 type:complete len:160 (-) Transcript_34134:138-617(-)